MQGDGNFGAIIGQGFIDGIIDNLEHHVMEAGAIVGITNVHAWAFTYRIQTFQHLNIGGVVARLFAHSYLSRKQRRIIPPPRRSRVSRETF